MLKAARFDGATFLELRDDITSTGQAFGVLTLVSLTYGIGFAAVNAVELGGLSPAEFMLGILTSMIWFLVTIFVWSITAFLVGTKLFRGVTTFKGLLRPIFFSTAPGLLFVLMVIPFSLVSQAIAALAWFWIIVAGVFAVKNAMGFSTLLGMLTFIIYVFIFYLLGPGIFLSFVPR